MNQRCYFHKSSPIQHFCSLKQCTLPLCQECLDIHQQEHQDKQTQPSIIPYHKAYQQVFNTLTHFLQNAKKIKQTYLQKLNHDKLQSIKAIEEYYAQYQNEIQQKSSSFTQIEQRLHKLEKGSIKTVIYFYSGDIKLKQPQFLEFQKISLLIQNTIQNIKNPQKQHPQIYKNQTINHLQNQDQQIKNTHFESKQRTNSKKKLIFSNQKYQQNLHKNTNYPYLQDPKIQPNLSNKIFQQQNKNISEQKSQVKNYFMNENYTKQNSVTRKQFNQNPTFFMDGLEQKKALKQAPIVSNIDYRETRSRTLDKYPSMAQFKISKENLYQPLVRDQQRKKMDTINANFRPGKWNREKINVQSIQISEKPSSIYSQFMVTEPAAQFQINRLVLQQEFSNRQPLKTTDLDAYVPLKNDVPIIQSRQRAFSYEPGLRTTMSHNNLQLGKKVQTILGDQLKKNVLSPQQIRKMLEKKIEERNKVLVQKKQHQLKINTNRTMTTNSATVNLRAQNLSQIEQRKDNFSKERQNIGSFNNRNFNFEPMNAKQLPFQIRSGLYNTRDSIINQIYRETKY